MAAHQAPQPLGFSRQEHWSGLPFSSPMHENEKWKWSCVQLSDPMDCSLPGSSIHGIFQARVLEWGAIAFSDTYTTMCEIDNWWESAICKKLSSVLCEDLDMQDWEEGGRSKSKGMHVCTQRIHFDVQQKLTQHCKVIIFQYKMKNKREKI